MSGTDETAPVVEAEPTLIEQTGDVPETVIIPEETPEAPDDAAPAVETAAPAADEPAKPKQKPWFQTRIDELTRQKHDEKRQREALEARLSALETPPVTDPAAPKPEDFDKAVTARAQQLLAQEEGKKRSQAWLSAGTKEYGTDDFNEKCATVAAMGAGDSPEFMKIITDPDILPDGHKVVAMLADNPDEASRILALEPLKMAAALSRFATTAKAPDKPLSTAPRPITPLGGSARGSSSPADTDDTKTWMAKREAQLAARRAN